MTDVDAPIDRSMATRNGADPDRRREPIGETWTEDAGSLDPIMGGEGRDGIDAMIAGVRTRFPGHRMRRTGDVDAHHDRPLGRDAVSGAERSRIVENTLERTAAGSTSRLTLLRRALLLDAVASGTMGAAMALAAVPLGARLDLPPALLRGAGIGLIPFAALLGALGSRERIARPAVLTVVAVNLLWVAGSLLVLVTGRVEPTALGVALVVAQALAVALFAGLQGLGLRRASPTVRWRR